MTLNEIIKFDKYFWIARVFPALITSIPFIFFQYIYLDNLFFDKLTLLEQYSVAWHSLITLLIVYLSSILVRAFGKDLIEKFYFIKNNKLPTTQILNGEKELMSKEELNNLRKRIKVDFNLNLTSNCFKKEKALRIKGAVKQILYRVGHENKILNQYNMEYGFFRNLAGGFIIYFPITFLLLLFSYSNNLPLFYLSIGMLIIELIYIGFSWYILDNYGTKYAEQLFSLYLSGGQ